MGTTVNFPQIRAGCSPAHIDSESTLMAALCIDCISDDDLKNIASGTPSLQCAECEGEGTKCANTLILDRKRGLVDTINVSINPL